MKQFWKEKNKTWFMVFILFGIMASNANAFQFNFRITGDDFKNRNWGVVILGGIMSYGTHELAHFAAAEIVGMDPSFKWDGGPVVWVDNYDKQQDSEKALFHYAGFLSQALVGTILTAVPKTRHSDFSLGFTGFTFGENTLYGFTGGIQKNEYSDVDNLNNLGYPGNEIAIAGGLYSGVLSFINLNKHKNKPKKVSLNDLMNKAEKKSK